VTVTDHIKVLVLLLLLVGGASPLAAKEPKQARATKGQKLQEAAVTDVPRCSRKLGTLSITDGDDPHGWTQHSLQPPAKLLKVLVQRSGCFNLVDRGTGLNAAQRERDIGGNLGLQRKSNVGQGEIKAADYVLVAEIQGANSNASGSAVGGRLGGLLGGLKIKKLEANTILSLTNVRTTETLAVVDGYAVKKDTSFGAGGFFGAGNVGADAVGGGYESTDIGRIVTLSFIQAYSKMVKDLGLVTPGAVGTAEAAPAKTFMAQGPVAMRKTAAAGGAVIRTLPAGSIVYPTGNKNGLFWEVADENDNTGWVLSTKLALYRERSRLSGPEEQLIPWPPPRASSIGDVTGSFTRSMQLTGYDKQIRAVLTRKGYSNLNYFSTNVPNGFVITTNVERLAPNGNPHRYGRMLKSTLVGSLIEYVKLLIRGDTGRFRVLVFIVSDQPPFIPPYVAKQVDLDRWKNNARSILSEQTASIPASYDMKVWLFVYEFVSSKSKSGDLIADNEGAFPFSLHKRFLGLK
jgi:curli biogenesis system outer membrane secretion channel CsgG